MLRFRQFSELNEGKISIVVKIYGWWIGCKNQKSIDPNPKRKRPSETKQPNLPTKLINILH